MLVIFGGQQFMANRPRYVNAFIYVSPVIRMCRARVREWREWKRRKSIISSHTSGTSTGQTRVTQFSLSSTPKTGLPFKKNARGWWPDRSYDAVRAGKINTCARFNQSKTLPMRTISKNIGKPVLSFPKFSPDSLIWHRQKSRDCDTHQQITKAVRLFLITTERDYTISHSRCSSMNESGWDPTREFLLIGSSRGRSVKHETWEFQCHPTGNSWRCSRKQKFTAVWYR